MASPNDIPVQGNGHHNGHNGSSTPASREMEASLLDVLLVFVRQRRTVMWSVAVCGGIALLIAMFSPAHFTSSAKVIREVEADASAPRSLSGLSMLRGLGLNLGGSSSGLTPDAYPDIALSREVRLAVVRDTFSFQEEGRRMTYVDYVDREPGVGDAIWDYSLGLPWTIKRALFPAPERPDVVPPAGMAEYPTKEEEEAMKSIYEHVGVGVDENTGLMTLSVTTNESLLSAELALSFSRHLVERVRVIRTQKSRDDLEFIREQFGIAEQSLRLAENELSTFDERNRTVSSARLRTDRDRLQRQVAFKAELYSDLQAQLTQAQIDLQRSQPVITVLENPVPPIKPSGPKRSLTVILGLLVGLMVGGGLAFIRAYIDVQREDEAERAKLAEIQGAIANATSAGRLRWWRSRAKKDA